MEPLQTNVHKALSRSRWSRCLFSPTKWKSKDSSFENISFGLKLNDSKVLVTFSLSVFFRFVSVCFVLLCLVCLLGVQSHDSRLFVINVLKTDVIFFFFSSLCLVLLSKYRLCLCSFFSLLNNWILTMRFIKKHYRIINLQTDLVDLRHTVWHLFRWTVKCM